MIKLIVQNKLCCWWGLLILTLYSATSVALDTISSKAMGGIYPDYPVIDYGTGEQSEQIHRGEYLVQIGNCIACHTDAARQIPPFAGGPAIETPFGKFYGSNITPDKETGIGHWTEADFIHAMQNGVAPDGSHYFPVFPYAYFNKLTEQDIKDIWAYMQRVPAVKQSNQPNTLPLLLNWRILQIGWKLLYFYPQQGILKYDPDKSPSWNRGQYLVEGLGHCAMCHTPIDILGGPKHDYHLTGNFIDGYWAPNITGLALARSSISDVVQVFTKGRLSLGAGIVAGPMAEVNHNSLSKLTETDQIAIATYLKSVESKQPIELDLVHYQSTSARGKMIYEEACAICHQEGQAGAPRIGNANNWKSRLKKGVSILYTNTINGFNSMPTKGACVTCTDDEIRAAVDYLLSRSLTVAQKRQLLVQTKPKNPLRSGQKIYDDYCSECHKSDQSNAPRIGDVEAWKPYLRQNMEILIAKTIQGGYRKPPNGGCADCSTSEIIEAVKYIVQQSSTDGDYTKW